MPKFKPALRIAAALGLVTLLSGCYYYAPPYHAFGDYHGYGGHGYGGHGYGGHGYGHGYGHGRGHGYGRGHRHH